MRPAVNHSLAPPFLPAPPKAGLARPVLSEFFRYHGLWAPGVRLFRCIGFRTKLLVISLVFVIPITVLASHFFNERAAAIRFAERERLAVAYLQKATQLLRALQEQRRWTVQAAVQASEPVELQATRGAVQSALKALAVAQAQFGPELGTVKAHQALVVRLQTLAAAPAGSDRVLIEHNEAIDMALKVLGLAVNSAKLGLDPDLDTHYLMDGASTALPVLTEAVSRLQASALAAPGAGVGLPELMKSVHAKRALGEHMAERWKTSVEKVATLRPDVPGLLAVDATLSGLHRFFEKAEVKDSAAGLNAAAGAALGSLSAAQKTSLERLDGLLAERVARLQNGRNAVAGLLLLSLFVVVYLFICFRKVLDGGLKEVAFHINAMRDGNLTTRPRAWGNDEAAKLMQTLTDMQSSLRRIVAEVRSASDGIVTASAQISSGAHDLSKRTERSAAKLEETAAAMEEVAATVRNAEDTVGEAARLAMTNADAAQRGGHIVGQVVTTMQQINESSARIGDITGTIDAIAFQTKILALNAAVEAARAGEQGRGFAVVAAEVRALAQRSGEAAREIKVLIGASLERVEKGTLVVREAGVAIEEIVASASRVRELLTIVSTGASEQTVGISQSLQAVQELDSVTQQNAALVEQTAAAAGSLKDRAIGLATEVAQFKLPAPA